jgi:formate hydrogenlyase subunit 3/multisubunit Na+/H+ antiporter MnhD subunit
METYLVAAPFVVLVAQAVWALLARSPLALLPWTLGGSGALLLVIGYPAWLHHADGVPDATSGFYLALLGVLYLALGPYLGTYLEHHEPRRARLEASLLPLFAAAMAGIPLAPVGYGFLFLWEGMTLLGYLLIALDGAAAVTGSRWFFIASRVSGAGLLLALILLSRGDALEGALKVLVWSGLLIGFGTKAALFPLHLWLPKAHPAAMSPLSALLSGGMTKLGLYGLYRSLTWAGAPPAWVGWALVVLGLFGAVYALVRGLAEDDYKAVLAYSSVENLNLLLAALGGYMLLHTPLFLLAFFFHQVAHALFKALLFLASGSLPGRALSELGGLWHAMPRTAAYTLLGIVAAAGLPPLAGFLGEWYLYRGFLAAPAGSTSLGLLVLGVGAIALASALAAALYVRLFGLAFLGLARSERAAGARDAEGGMNLGLALLAAALLLVSALPRVVLSGMDAPLYPVLPLFLALALAGGGLYYALRRRRHTEYGTWDCGNGAPTARMQPNGLGYSEQLLRALPLIQLQLRSSPTRADDPEPGQVRVVVRDPVEAAHERLGALYLRLARTVQRLQSGSIHIYLMLQFLALVIVLVVIWP